MLFYSCLFTQGPPDATRILCPDFHQTFPYILLYFHTKTLIMLQIRVHFAVNNAHHGSIVNKCKSSKQLIFFGKIVFLEFLKLIFFHKILHTDAKWQYLKCDSPIFFCSKMLEVCQKIVSFLHFLKISSLVFS